MTIYSLGLIHLESVLIANSHINQSAVDAVNKYLLNAKDTHWVHFDHSNSDHDAVITSHGEHHNALQSGDGMFESLHASDSHHGPTLGTYTDGNSGSLQVTHGAWANGKSEGLA